MLTTVSHRCTLSAMEGVLVLIVIIAAALSRPIEARLWRAGVLSDRSTAILFVGRFPVVCLLFGLIVGAELPLLLGITLLALVPSLLFYRFMLTMLQDKRHEADDAGRLA